MVQEQIDKEKVLAEIRTTLLQAVDILEKIEKSKGKADLKAEAPKLVSLLAQAESKAEKADLADNVFYLTQKMGVKKRMSQVIVGHLRSTNNDFASSYSTYKECEDRNDMEAAGNAIRAMNRILKQETAGAVNNMLQLG